MLEDNYITLSLIQSLPNGCLKEVLNHNKYLQLRARWRGQLWYFIFLSLKIFPSQSVSLSVCLLEPGVYTD